MPATAASAPPPDRPGAEAIDEIVGRYTTLTDHGTGQLRGDCPFCTTALLRVRPSQGTFHCWKCGSGGDAKDFEAQIRA